MTPIKCIILVYKKVHLNPEIKKKKDHAAHVLAHGDDLK